MQEKQKPVFVIATANSIDALPPEFLRKGRFDEIFFADLPTHAERMQILKVHLIQRLNNPAVLDGLTIDDETLRRLADASEGYSGAELEQALIAGVFDAFAEDRSVRLEDLERAISNMVPLSVTQAEQIAAVRAWADVRAVAATSQEDRALPADDSPARGPEPETRGGRAVDF